MIIKAIREYILTCPVLEMFSTAVLLNINYLSENIDSYSIEEVPCEPIIKRYADGSSKRQYQFTFCSKEPYGAEILQNIENSGFYEEFAEWIEENNNNSILPILEGNLEATSIKITSSSYVVQVTEDTATYQINLKLEYIKRKD